MQQLWDANIYVDNSMLWINIILLFMFHNITTLGMLFAFSIPVHFLVGVVKAGYHGRVINQMTVMMVIKCTNGMWLKVVVNGMTVMGC